MTRTQFSFGNLLIVLLYVVLALAYSVVNPAFESPDELYHFDYVEGLLRSQRLPVAGTEFSESHQPPLYYAAGALLSAWLPPGRPASDLVERNPYWPWRIGEVGVDNKSQFVHGPEQASPYQGLWLRLHLLRAFSVALGAVTVWLTGRLALALWPRRYAEALLAMALVGFLPQFLLISSSVSNDIAATALSALILVVFGRFLLSVDASADPATVPNTQAREAAAEDTSRAVDSRQAHPLRWALLLGLLLGSAALVKMSMLLLWPVTGLVLLAYAWVHRPGRSELWTSYLLVAIVTVAVAGPYLWRNWQIYGDPTALSQMDAAWGRRVPPLSWPETLQKIPNIWTSFVARFGYGQIPVPNAFYMAGAGLTLIALAGLVIAWRQYRPLRSHMGGRFWLLAYAVLLILVLMAAVIRYTQTSFTGDFGRFVFPALPALAGLLALGWTTTLAQCHVRPMVTATGLTAILALSSLWVLLAILRPAYTMPVPTEEARVGAASTAEPGRYFDDIAVLRRASVLNPALAPSGDALVQVELLPLRRTETPLTFFIWLVGPNGEPLGDRHSYPGMGRLSTTFWQPGEPIVDSYRVPVDETVARSIAPAAVQIYAGLYDRSTDSILPTTEGPSGPTVWKPVAEAKLPPPGAKIAGQAPSQAALATFGDSLQLNAFAVPPAIQRGSTLPITLTWTVSNPVPSDFKLFLHLVSPDDLVPLAQVDEPILAGRYPARLWGRGEQLQDSHDLPIPPALSPGTYRLVVGLYRDEAGLPRLPAQAGTGATGENSYVLGGVQVKP